MNEMLRLADNPIFVKHLRSRLRRSAVVSGLVVVAFLCICICFIDYMQREQFNRMNNAFEVSSGLIMLAFMQGIILNLMGGAQVAQSIAYVKDSGILDYHRITPLPSRVQTIGFLAGAPIREYLFYIATLPFMLGLALVSNAGLGGFSKMVLVQIGFAVFSHALGLLVGLSTKSSKGASGRFVAIMIGLSIFSNVVRGAGMFNNERYYGPALVSPIPVMGEVLEPRINRVAFQQQMNQQMAMQQAQAQMKQAQMNLGKKGNFGNNPQLNQPFNPQPVNFPPIVAPEAKFLGIEIPLVLQTLFVQAVLIFFIFIGCSRRIRSSRIPIYGKPHAIAFFATLCFLALATLWGLKQEAILMINTYALTFFGCILLGMSTQTFGEIAKGYQRAAKAEQKALSPWNDLASNHMTVLMFVGIFAAFAAIDYFVMTNGAQIFNGIPIESFVPMFAVAVGTLLVTGFMVQFFYLKYDRKPGARLGLYIFFAWIAPIILGAIFGAQGMTDAAFFFAVSPITAIGGVVNPNVFQGFRGGADITDAFRQVAYVALALQAILFLVLSHARERRLRDSVHAERREDEFLDKVESLPAEA